MIKIVFLMLISLASFAQPVPNARYDNLLPEAELLTLLHPGLSYIDPASADLVALKNMFQEQAPGMRPAVVAKTMAALACAQKFGLRHDPVLTVIDYSLPSNQKRFWVFDLDARKLLYHTHVSHGITSGALHPHALSNVNNSKATSLGVYLTGQSYYGREGYSLRLGGLEQGFNQNAMRRYIVMHGGWYMDEDFITQYGRPGRSWGCPTLPTDLSREIINTIKDKSFLIIYYPVDDWFLNSRFLNCGLSPLIKTIDDHGMVKQQAQVTYDKRDPILFADKKDNNKRDRSDPIIVVQAQAYKPLFGASPPLERMLRRTINGKEYIGISPGELERLLPASAYENSNELPPASNAEAAERRDCVATENDEKLSKLSFIIPVVLKQRGRYVTQMKKMDYGTIKAVCIRHDADNKRQYVIEFSDNKKLKFQPHQHFIRWLGL